MLRPATETDFPFIRSVAGNPAYERFVGDEDEVALAAHFANADSALLIWEDGAAPAGFALFCERTNPANRLELRRLALAQSGKGIGQRFVEDLRDHAFNEMGCDCLWLDVAADNPRARTVYERAGFTFEGRLRARWRRPTGDVADLDVFSVLRSEWLERA